MANTLPDPEETSEIPLTEAEKKQKEDLARRLAENFLKNPEELEELARRIKDEESVEF
jgi:hypothetical protein